jgi:AmpE protein
MKLIVLLAVLGLERYLGLGDKLRRFFWFDVYLARLHHHLGKQAWFKGMVGALISIAAVPLVIVIVTCILSYIFGHGFHLFMWLLLSIVVLLYALGPKDIYQQVRAYINATANHDAQTSDAIEKEILEGASPSEPHAFTKSIFWQANQDLFGTLFWYMLFGLFGALFYRCTVLLSQSDAGKKGPGVDQQNAAQQIQNVLDWIPVRVFMLFFSLVGTFNAGFSYWIENIISGLGNNRRFISEGGFIALGPVKSEKGSQHAEEYMAALSLIDRSLIIFLAIVALFTLGSWVY